MNKLIMGVVLMAICSTSAMAKTSIVNCKVVGVMDGDTIKCLTSSNEQIKVRLNQIDAPEKKQDFGQASKRRLSDLIYSKQVNIQTSGKGRYGRTIGEIYHNGNNINKQMVRDGMAWAYMQYVKDVDYLALENQARSSKIGLWSHASPIYPSDYRKGKKRKVVTKPNVKWSQPKQSNAILSKPSSQSGFSCSGGSKKYCKHMTTCAEAKYYLNTCGLSRLDRDKDGVPCEALCK